MQNTVYIGENARGGTSLLSIKYYHSSAYSTLAYFLQYKGTATITITIDTLTDTVSATGSAWTDASGSIDISSLADGYYTITITADADIEIKNIILTEEE